MSLGATNKGAVSKLVQAWEAKNNERTKRAAGLGLMAVSLAACGGSDDTPYSQDDIDALESEISTLTTNLTTVTAARDALAVQLSDIEDAIEAAGHDNVDDLVAQRDELVTDLAAANAEVADLTTDLATMTGLRDALQGDLDDLLSELAAAGFTDLTDLINAYVALVTPVSRAFTINTDSLIGSAGNDTFTAAAGTVAAADSVTDTSTTDNDTINIVSSGAVAAFRSTNVENINITINSLAADAVDATNFSGVNSLSITRGDVTIGGATLTGNKVVTVNAVNASNVDAITVGAGTTDVVVAQVAAVGGTGVTLNADAASGNVTVTGAATISAAGAGAGDTVTVNVSTVAAEDAKAVSVTTGAATVTIGAFTGTVAVTAASASDVNIAGATGGVTIVAAAAPTADSTVDVVDIDASGASITVGTGADNAATAANIAIDVTIDGTAALTDAATISGAGHIELDIDGNNAGNVDIITLSGNGAAVVFDLAAPAAGTAVSFTKAGNQSVEIMGDASEFSGVTITNIDIVDIISTGAAADFDASLFSGVGLVDLGVDNGGAGVQITVANGQTWEITADQTGLDFDFSTTTIGDLTVVAGDDNGADDPTVGTITVAAFNAAAGAATTVGTVTVEASMANFTATSTVLGAAQTLVVTGDEDVTLGTVTALAVNAANSSGIISLTAGENVATVATGSGADAVIIDDRTGGGAVIAHAVTTGAGNDTITVTSTAATATIDAGAGNDAFTLTATTAYVVSGGEGNDTFTTTADIEAVVLGGNGTDTFTVGAATLDFSNNTQFALNSIETVNLTAATGTTTLSAAQLAANSTFAITADGDTLQVNTTATGSVDGSGITISAGSTATISYLGLTGANAMTGGVEAETFQGGDGADTIVGGDGNDTFVAENATNEQGASANASVGMVVNLGATAVTGAAIFALTGDFLGGSVTSVAAGTATHLYAANVAGNASVVDTLSSIENLTGGTGTDYLIGSVGDNVITGGAGADFLTGGLGADTFVFATGASGITVATADVITDFVSGTDSISLGLAGDATANTGNYVEANAAVADFAAALVAANVALAALDGAQNNVQASLFAFQFDATNGYLFEDVDGDGDADQVIILTGIDNTEILAADITA